MIDECFLNEGDFDLKNAIKSYLVRETWVQDKFTGEKVELKRTHSFKTAPQGSTLSPKLWRIFDQALRR